MTSANPWGDYEVLFDKVLGRGGMGVVYKGRQISVNRPVAIKILKRDLTESPDFVRRFYREATLLAKLVDSHIVQVYGAGETDGQHWYAMEFVEGEDLSARLRRGYQFTIEEILQIAMQTAGALQIAWKEKIIHRDIKPSNILITKDGLVKVMDFGLAKNPEHDLTQTEMIMGTAKYMSPEQATGAACDIRSDLYSLGAVMYELSTGTAPFVGESPTAVIYQHVHKSPVPPQKLNPSLPGSLQSVILRLLAKKREERYQAPEDVIKDCRAILEGVTVDEKTVLFGQVSETADSSTEAAAKEPEEEKGTKSGLILSLVGAGVILSVVGYFVITALVAPPQDTKKREQTPNGAKVENGSGNGKTNGTTDPQPKPEWEAQFAEILGNGDAAFGDKKWSAAIAHYEKALTLLPETDARRKDVGEKIQRSRFKETLDNANSLSDPEKQIALLTKALEYAQTDPEREVVGTLLKPAKAKKAVNEGDKRMGSDWANAAASYREAAGFVDGADEKGKLEKKAEFCAGVAEALKHGAKLEDSKAKIEALLLQDTYGYTEFLQKELGSIEQKIRDRDAMAEKERERRFQEGVAAAREKAERCLWSEADASLSPLEAEEYRKYHTDEYRALQRVVGFGSRPPEGMVYIPAGRYPIGGGDPRKPEFGPEKKDVEVAEFFLDVQEVTKTDYEKFLQALEGKEHLPTCHPDEAKKGKKSHLPRGFASLEATAAVREVDWYDAFAYAAWAGKRLATEIEFEVATSWVPAERRRRLYAWGDEFGEGKGTSAFGVKCLTNDLLEWTSSEFRAYEWGSATHSRFGKGNLVLRGGYKLEKESELRAFTRFDERPEKAGHFTIRCAKTP